MANNEIENIPVVPDNQESLPIEQKAELKVPEVNNQPEANASLNTEEVKPKKKINVKILLIIVLIIVIGALVYFFKGLFIAATVNGVPISRLAVIAKLEKSSGKDTLDSLITQRLIEEEAAKKGITVNQEEINAEIKKVEDEIKAQNLTLDQALAYQGITQDDFKEQVVLQIELEKMLADKIQVTDAEVDQYFKDNEITIPAGQESSYKDQAKAQLQHQKLSDAAGQLINTLRSQAKINYFVTY